MGSEIIIEIKYDEKGHCEVCPFYAAFGNEGFCHLGFGEGHDELHQWETVIPGANCPGEGMYSLILKPSEKR